jgi:hypothetical protein
MIDRLINFGMGDSGETIQILRYTVDDVITPERYDDRIEETYMTSRVDELPKGIAQRTPEYGMPRRGLITASTFTGRQTGAIRP